MTSSARGRLLGSFLLYAAIALVLFRRLLPHIADGFPHDAGDPVLSAWALWWNAHHVPFTSGWWDGLAFFPEHGSLAFSDHRVGLGLIASPILWLGGGPILAHNIVFLLSFPLCAIAAHALAREVTGSDVAGLIAGLTFGFNPYRMDHLPHLELLAVWWLPLALLALHRYARDGGARWLALFACSLALQGLSGGYYFFFAVPLIAAWIVWFVRPVSRMIAVGIAWAASVIPLLPVLLGYRHFLGRLDLHRAYDEIRFFSADFTGLLSGAPQLAVWHSSPALRRQEGDIFTGVFAIALVAACLLVSLRRKRPPTAWFLRRVQIACLLLAVILEVAALSGLAGGWSVRLAGASISVHEASRPATAAAALLAIAALTSPAAVDALRRRSLFAFYAGAAVLLWLFTLGPVPTFLGERALFRGPYSYLMSLPGFDTAFRVPARFAMVMALALSIAAALAYARVTAGSRAVVRRLFGAFMAAGILLDGWTGLPVAPAPDRWQWPADSARAAAVLELPVGGDGDEIAAVWRSLDHGRPVINGYSGYDPPHHRLLRHALERRDGAVLDGVAEYGPVLVALDTEHADAAFWHGTLAAAIPVSRDADKHRAFMMLPRADPPAKPAGVPLAIVSASANAGRFVLQDVTDGNPLTRWVSDRFQRGDEEILLQLDGPRQVAGVVLSMGIFAEEYPRRLRIETSVDGGTWRTGLENSPSGIAFSAILRDAKRAQLAFRIPDVESRYVRLRQVGADRTAYWSICDITVLGR